MKSIMTVYKIGNGPSSSHTVGPYQAATFIKERFPNADDFTVTLYGSLAFTGEGHGTSKAILSALPNAKILNDFEEKNLPHPNTMNFLVKEGGKEVANVRIMSIGGGSIKVENEDSKLEEEIYKEKNFTEILEVCEEKGWTLSEYAYSVEGSELKDYLHKIWNTMQDCLERGLNTTGTLPGGLLIKRKAMNLYNMRCHNESSDITMDRLISSFAYAVSEENASENIIVTAPTCGASGIIPAIMYYMKTQKGFSDDEIVDALCAAGVVGNVIRTNASISGAECGCQAEVGSACSMAAAGLASLYGLNLRQVEYAAEVAMEHHLGLTCDPVNGLVQIPCIERNAVAAMRAVNAVNLSRFLFETRKISFDTVVETMYRTGLDLNDKYRETSNGGLAVLYGD